MLNSIIHFLRNFDNRQLAIFLWLTIVLFVALFNLKIRKAFCRVIKMFFAWKLTVLYVGMFVYISLLIFSLMFVGLWKSYFWSILLLRVLFVAFPLLLNFSKANEKDFLRLEVKNSLKVTVFAEFIVNFYVFPFGVEFILVPILAIVSVLIVVSETDEKCLQVKKFLNGVLAIFGTILLIYFILMLKSNFLEFATFRNVENFCVPILITILFLPYVYLVALLANCESFVMRLKWFVKDKGVLKYAKYKTIWNFGLRPQVLNEWSRYVCSGYRFKDKGEVDKAIQEFKKKLKT